MYICLGNIYLLVRVFLSNSPGEMLCSPFCISPGGMLCLRLIANAFLLRLL